MDAMSAAAVLNRELKTYQDKFAELAPANEGKFALVHGADLVEVLDSYEDALKIGYERFGLEPFLVKKISTTESVCYFTRHLGS
jgi:hypothetical protein